MDEIGIKTAPISLIERKTTETMEAYLQNLFKCGKWYNNNTKQNIQEV